MKKILITIAIITVALIAIISKVESTDTGTLFTFRDGTGYYVETAEPQTYTAYGRYYTDGTVITNDGNEWGYMTDLISDKTPTDGMPVLIGFDDNGTPNDITDDIILGLVYDRNTAIYDDLETALSDKFELERDGNNIHIKGVQ